MIDAFWVVPRTEQVLGAFLVAAASQCANMVLMSRYYKDHTVADCKASGCIACLPAAFEQRVIKEQVDILPDLSQELASMGRGSMQRRIQALEAALDVAKFALDAISDDRTDGMMCKIVADTALGKIAVLERS